VLFLLGIALAGVAWVAPTSLYAFGIAAAAVGVLSAAFALALRMIFKDRTIKRDLRAAARLIEHDPAPCFCTDADGAIVHANAAARGRFGPRDRHPMARALAGLFPNAPAVIFRLETTLAQSPMARETLVTRRGHVRLTAHRLGSGALWRLDDGVESALRSGDGIGLPMMVISSHDTILSMNAAMRDMLGKRAKTLHEVFPDVPLVAGRPARLDGATAIIDVMPIIVSAPDGRREVYAVPGLTEPPAASVAARAFEALPVALLHIGADGKVLASNRHAQSLLGLAPDERGHVAGLVEGLGRPIGDWLQDTLEQRIASRPEVVRAKRLDEARYLQITLGRISDVGGTSLLAVLHDATELKTLEQQFVQSQKMQAIGELAGGIAHDFNNLLTAISGHCDLLLLRHDQGDPDYADLMQINQNANRAAALVGQLLAFSRKQTLQPELIDLRDTMADMTHLLNRLVGGKIRLTLSHDPDLLPIRADRRQFDQVLMNLVVNARDAMPDGGEIRVQTRVVHLTETLQRDRAQVPPGRYVVVLVRDKGHGIPSDKLGRIFEPFYTTKRTGEGTGLGLSMAYGIIKQSGGYIFVDSLVGSGTTFSIYCPAHDPVAAVTVVPATVDTAAPVTALPERAGHGVVLLVEDEAPVRAFASRALRLRGYTVLEAENAEEALETLKDSALKVDLFLTDVVMPGMDGPTWVRQALRDRPDAKVVFVSGYAEDAFEDGSVSIPNSVFLPKPFSLSDLTDTVQRQLH
jgi:two-component system cell cycle sensor histidine kinase/response regulator CckA